MDVYNKVMSLSTELRERLLAYVVEHNDHDMEEMYNEFLDEVYPDCTIAGYTYTTSDALRCTDPTAYRCGFSDWIGTHEDYIEIEGNYYNARELELALEVLEDE